MIGAPVVYRFGPFELDPAGSRFFRDGTRVRLSGPQFAILAHPVANAGVVFSKDVLVDVGWGGLEVGENSLDQAIHRLRRLLGRGPDGLEYIETLPQRGYRLGVPVERIERDLFQGPLDAQLEPYV